MGLFGDIIDHVGIYGFRVAEALSAFNVGLVYSIITFSYTKYFVHSYTIEVVFTLSY